MKKSSQPNVQDKENDICIHGIDGRFLEWNDTKPIYFKYNGLKLRVGGENIKTSTPKTTTTTNQSFLC